MNRWLLSNQLNIECLDSNNNLEKCNGYVRYMDLCRKFPKDCVDIVNADCSVFLDGYVSNKNELNKEYGYEKWEDTFSMIETGQILSNLRGGFCGYRYNAGKNEFLLFTDHMGNKAVYYYMKDSNVILSNNINDIAKVLKENHIAMEIDERAVLYMLTYGFMMDDTTFIKNVKRVMPGQYVRIVDDSVELVTYYQIDNTKTESITEEQAVEKLDAAFRNAIRREFEKDREYGYRHLVDLSGGLDSRMVCMVAHDMGYTDQMNFTYCRPGYLDQKISEQIAADLKHEYLFKSLDDIRWMYDIDEIVSKNNGAALFSGITGGNRFLKSIDLSTYGIEHTGMIGDAIVSTFYKDESFNYSEPKWGYHRYSEKMKAEFDNSALTRYPNQEICAIYTRGILGAQSSYIIRQHYLETASPFMDVDFLNVCFSLPFAYRKNHHIYLKWMKEKYPQACEYGWEKWGGVKPKENLIFFRRIVTGKKLLKNMFLKMFNRQSRDSMNPMDYWYRQDRDIQLYYKRYYEENISNYILTEQMRKDIQEMFETGNFLEMAMALTVLSAAKQYFG